MSKDDGHQDMLGTDSYWEQACRFFHSSGFASSEGSYFFHNKNQNTVKIGILCQVSVSVDTEHIHSVIDGLATVENLPSGESIFTYVEKTLRHDVPVFFVVSPDIYRKFVDKSLPLLRAVQPIVEFVFSPDRTCGAVNYAQNKIWAQRGEGMLALSTQTVSSTEPDDVGELPDFSPLIRGWTASESDAQFSRRLAAAITTLQDHPEGKMTLTRAYEHRLDRIDNPFLLYELHARKNGDYACSHYFCLSRHVISLGTTPENVLEVSGGALTVDVVAATCRASESDDYLSRALYDDPKQLKEHTSSLVNRQNRFRPFCREDSIRLAGGMKLKRLRNVCHLHSVFTADLLPGVTIFDLMGAIFPLLGARPKGLLPLADSEEEPHRYYGGVVGHLHHATGGCFLNIRNALLDHDVLHAKVGVGVMPESNAHHELLETQDKLSGLLEAVSRWEETISVNSESDT